MALNVQNSGLNTPPALSNVDWERVTVSLALASEALMGTPAGTLSDEERRAYVALALQVIGRHSQAPGDAVTDFDQQLTYARHVAGMLPIAEAPGHDNPFRGTALAAIYDAEKGWQARATTPQPETLQALLNKRSELVDMVQARATAMHQAQEAEAQLFDEAMADPASRDRHSASSQLAAAVAKDFRSAVEGLRQFREAPTQNPDLKRAFGEVESLEIVLARTARSITDAESAGLATDESDRRDLREIHMQLTALLQRHDATMPVRDDIGLRQTSPGQFEIQAVKPGPR